MATDEPSTMATGEPSTMATGEPSTMATNEPSASKQRRVLSTSVKADPTKLSFLDLHGEIRNRIYRELLPSAAALHFRPYILPKSMLIGQVDIRPDAIFTFMPPPTAVLGGQAAGHPPVGSMHPPLGGQAVVRPAGRIPLPTSMQHGQHTVCTADGFVRTAYAFRPGSSDKRGSSTAFMATCRQVHEEAASLLYAKKEFVIHVDSNGVRGWKEPVAKGYELLTRNLSALNQASILTIEVAVALDELYGICDIQHSLFALFTHFRIGHMLHRVNFEIDARLVHGGGHFPEDHVEKEYDGHLVRRFIRRHGRDLYSLRTEDEEEAEEDPRMYSTKEIDRISPGDVSEHHIVAFLTEPLRTIRNLGDAIDKGVLRVEFNGCPRKPLGGIPSQVSDLMQSEAPVLDYHVFRPYYEQLSLLVWLGQCMLSSFIQDALSALDKLAAQRIRGDIPAFRLAHHAFVEQIAKTMPSTYGPHDKSNYYFTQVSSNPVYKQRSDRKWLESFEQAEREMEYRMLELEQLLPPDDTDLSFLGCRQVDDDIREHHLRKKARIRKAALELLEQHQGRAAGSRRMSV